MYFRKKLIFDPYTSLLYTEIQQNLDFRRIFIDFRVILMILLFFCAKETGVRVENQLFLKNFSSTILFSSNANTFPGSFGVLRAP